jgi:hypothetical protein
MVAGGGGDASPANPDCPPGQRPAAVSSGRGLFGRAFQCGHTHSPLSLSAHFATQVHFPPPIPVHRIDHSTGSISLHLASRHRWSRSTPCGVRRATIAFIGHGCESTTPSLHLRNGGDAVAAMLLRPHLLQIQKPSSAGINTHRVMALPRLPNRQHTHRGETRSQGFGRMFRMKMEMNTPLRC